MDLGKVLAQLHNELENLDKAIASLEKVQQGNRRRVRQPEVSNKTRAARACNTTVERVDDGDE
jgi:hypothetical protein